MTIVELLQNAAQIVVSNLTITFLLLLLVIWIYYEYAPVHKDFPPGPKGVPLFGYAPFIRGKLEENFNDIGKKYGDVFSIKLGPERIVVLNTYDAIKEAFVKNADLFHGRPQGFNLFNYFMDYVGFIVENGWLWQIQRRFTLSTLRDFGMGRQNIELQIQLESEVVVEEIATKQDKPFDIQNMLTNATSNIISSVTFGKRFKYDDPVFQELIDFMVNRNPQFDQSSLISVLPWLRFLPHTLTDYKKVDTTKANTKKFIMERIDEHIATYDENNIRDYIDAFWSEMTKPSNRQENGKSPFDFDHLVSNVIILFLAGTLTTSSTLYWALKMLIMYPKVQEKVQKEIDTVVGCERLPAISDRAKMPYTDAVIMEVQRYGDILPLGVPRTPVDSTKLFGYHLPQNTIILPNLHNVHNDKKLWGDPENFRPERFIGADGKASKPEYLMPFQIGKRICLGEALAKMELFLFLTTILQNFTFKSPAGVQPLITYKSRESRHLGSYELCAVRRNK